LVNWSEVSRDLTKILKLKCYPVAVKLFSKLEDVPKEARKPRDKITVCQFVSLAKNYGWILSGTAENIVCAYGASNLGLATLPEDMKSGERAVKVYAEDIETTRKIAEKVPKIETGKFSAFMVSPLEKSPTDPDVILVPGNSAQMMRLILGITWKKEFDGRLYFSSAAHCGVCGDGIAAVYTLNKPHLGIPCYGARSFALFQDDELVMGIPAGVVEAVLEGLRKTHEVYMGYPITPTNLPLTPPAAWLYPVMFEKPPENWKERLLKAPREIL